MKRLLLLAVIACGILPVSAATWILMTPPTIVESSDLIALVEVGKVHEVTTPEGFRLQSATATIKQLVFLRHALVPDAPLVIYSLDRNAPIDSGDALIFNSHTGLPIKSGLAFVFLKLSGMNKFHPEGPLSFQIVNEEGKISWPRKGYRPGKDSPYVLMTVEEAIATLRPFLPDAPSRQ